MWCSTGLNHIIFTYFNVSMFWVEFLWIPRDAKSRPAYRRAIDGRRGAYRQAETFVERLFADSAASEL